MILFQSITEWTHSPPCARTTEFEQPCLLRVLPQPHAPRPRHLQWLPRRRRSSLQICRYGFGCRRQQHRHLQAEGGAWTSGMTAQVQAPCSTDAVVAIDRRHRWDIRPPRPCLLLSRTTTGRRFWFLPRCFLHLPKWPQCLVRWFPARLACSWLRLIHFSGKPSS